MQTITENDILLDIATGRSRREKFWKNVQMSWDALCERLKETHRTAETIAEYLAEKRDRQDEIKDIGGFVGGLLTGGRRKPEAVLHRSVLTLDLDTATNHSWTDFTRLYDCAAAVYSTHKHTPESPRLRLVIPLSRTVNPTEYEAIGRRIAGSIGIEQFDHTGFQPYRLMYWPSTAKDGVFFYDRQQGEFLDPDRVLVTYHDYTDSSQWPVSEKMHGRILQHIRVQGDPLQKRGWIGAFCRCYSIQEVIETYLADVYAPVEGGDGSRYSYVHGSTAQGLVVYEDKWTYSHHGTDPTSGRLCNAFDLVRLHLFGLQDEESREVGTKLPSYKAMIKLASEDPRVKAQRGEEMAEEAETVFGDTEFLAEEREKQQAGNEQVATDSFINLARDLAGLGVPRVKEVNPEDKEWFKSLEYDNKNELKSTVQNILLILQNDSRLARRFALDDFTGFIRVLGSLPWQKINVNRPAGRTWVDIDDSGLRHYLETVYKISAAAKVRDARDLAAEENRYHPVRNYLQSLNWDGKKRLERVLADYMGADDSEYSSTVFKKWATAAVARIFDPGCKFEYALTFLGPEGIFKSTFFNILGAPWFTDDFSFHMIGNNRAIEQIRGKWIIEIGELVGIRRAEGEGIKAFLGRMVDRMRGAYKEHVVEWLRQCVFGASTNEEEFLRGAGGNRRFWVVRAHENPPVRSMTELLKERDQLWAEAVYLYRMDEPLYLPHALEKIAREIQEENTERDERTACIAEYLEKKLPENWDKMNNYERREYLNGDSLFGGAIIRQFVSSAEIWVECLGCQLRDLTSAKGREIADIMRKMPGWKRVNKQRRLSSYGIQRGYERI